MAISESHLPRTESFIDSRDKKRIFEFSLLGKNGGRGYRVTAREVTDDEGGYIFVESSPSLDHCLDRLRIKIKLRLAIKSTVVPQPTTTAVIAPSQNILSGTIADDGIIIDGKLIDWKMFVSIITPHEGLKMNLSIVDPAS
ncbi:hypothetical protein [Desulfopila sp. IMCC35008]|uniref:DUF7713 domain-containing protein n=1 Tax=Desulfopila sp. IMCC35008 TaxID=2653858 RepID=UPI0013D69C33|nr:hypothetical protein [Desulfopila sp. IMCC35008]